MRTAAILGFLLIAIGNYEGLTRTAVAEKVSIGDKQEEGAPDAVSIGSRIEIGLSAGISFASIHGPETNDSTIIYHFREGFIGRLLLGYQINQYLSFSAGAGFITKGYDSARRTDDGEMYSGTLYLGYLQFPGVVHISSPAVSILRPYLILGGELDILIDADLTFADGQIFELNRLIENFDYSVIGGLGTTILVGPSSKVTIEGTYARGLKNIATRATEDSAALNQSFYLTIGYRTDISTLMRRLTGGDSGAPKAVSGG